ncbi:hypothetical protein AX15_000161 [Amanita polypyramis BW_CC]|nr:hypothetical protein AX15_000161 [Amanita polypyramis BW_CC]
MSRTPRDRLFQFGSPSEGLQQNTRKTRAADFFSPLRFNRLSTQAQHSATEKGKYPIRGEEICDSPVSVSQQGNGFHTADTYDAVPSRVTVPIPRPRPADASRPGSANVAKKRGSVLIAASDVLSFKFGRKKPTSPARLPPNTALFPEVIEITAHTPDAERLREEAAQFLGISVDQEAQSVSPATEVDEQETDILSSHASCLDDAGKATYTRGDFSNRSSNSLPSPPRPSTLTSGRSSSVMTHNRRTSIVTPHIPPFPASIDALQSFKQLVASFPKYYPPTSLRLFALSKNWKIRHLILTSPLTLVTGGSDPAVSYLHVFKSFAAGETETERLEINEDSVVFIAEEDVGGRKHVIKVGGRDEGGMRKDQIVEEGGRTMWFFQISDSGDSQKWISTIKNVILGQRTIRAGLTLPTYGAGGIEPRGDMDVMLSIRQQGIVTARPTLRQSTNSPPPVVADGNYASSVSSHSVKSLASGPRSPASSTSASGLRGFFTSIPRAASRATSIESEQEGESYASMSHMLGKLRPNSAASKKSSEKSFVPPLSSFTSNALQRRIFQEHPGDSSSEKTGGGGGGGDRTTRGSSLASSSLQPPPRRRRTSGAVATPTTTTFTDLFTEFIPLQDTQLLDEPPSSPRPSQFEIPQQRPRVPSVQSFSTAASTDNTASQERSSVSTRSTRRWSRQSVLPARPNPPSGPPPGPPVSTHLQPHPYATELGMVRTSSNQSMDKNSTSASPPSFSAKRASTASAFSVRSAATSQSFITVQSRSSRPSSAHRTSIPPTKPAPTSALPPAPEQVPSSAPPSKSSFRESVAARVGRLSVTVPNSPSVTTSPPQPAEKSVKSHRRASSGSYFSKPANPNPSASSLTFVPNSDLPAPRPVRPLPPTPDVAHDRVVPSRPVQRESLLKRRLRMLSAPSTPVTKSTEIFPADIPSRPDTVASSRAQTPKLATTTLISQPTTPIAEKITSFQNDPSFLQLDTPTIPSLPPPRPLPPTPDQLPEMTSLSPPPRRYSRQIFPAEIPSSETAEIPVPTPKPPAEGEHRLISLSRPGSVVSLGILSM